MLRFPVQYLLLALWSWWSLTDDLAVWSNSLSLNLFKSPSVCKFPAAKSVCIQPLPKVAFRKKVTHKYANINKTVCNSLIHMGKFALRLTLSHIYCPSVHCVEKNGKLNFNWWGREERSSLWSVQNGSKGLFSVAWSLLNLTLFEQWNNSESYTNANICIFTENKVFAYSYSRFCS